MANKMARAATSVEDQKHSVRTAHQASDQFVTVMGTMQEYQDARAIDDAAKEHLVKLLIEEGMFHCFSLNMRAVARTFR